MYLLLIFTLILFACFFVPIRINVKYNNKALGKLSDYDKIDKVADIDAVIKLLYYIPVFHYKKNTKSDDKDKDKKSSKKQNHFLNLLYSITMELIGYKKISKALVSKSDIKKILKSVEYEKFSLNLGFNIEDPIANSYINASLNTILCMYINYNIDKFDLKKLYYLVYVSKNVYEIQFDGILRFKLVDNIYEILKIIFRFFKIKINSRKVEDKNGRASNRKFNGDRNDFARKYD